LPWRLRRQQLESFSEQQSFAAVRDTCALPQALPAGSTLIPLAFGMPGGGEVEGTVELVKDGVVISSDRIVNYEGTYGAVVFPEPGTYTATLRVRGNLGPVDAPVSVLAPPVDIIADVRSPESGTLFAEVPEGTPALQAVLTDLSTGTTLPSARREPFGNGARFVWTGLNPSQQFSLEVSDAPQRSFSYSGFEFSLPRLRLWPVRNTRLARANGTSSASVRVEKARSPGFAVCWPGPNPGQSASQADFVITANPPKASNFLTVQVGTNPRFVDQPGDQSLTVMADFGQSRVAGFLAGPGTPLTGDEVATNFTKGTKLTLSPPSTTTTTTIPPTTTTTTLSTTTTTTLSTTTTPTTSTTIPATTTIPGTTTIPETTTTVEPSNSLQLSVAGAAAVGAGVKLFVRGSKAGAHVDLSATINGVSTPLGSPYVDAQGDATITTSFWVAGTYVISGTEQVWKDGSRTSRTVTATIEVTTTAPPTTAPPTTAPPTTAPPTTAPPTTIPLGAIRITPLADVRVGQPVAISVTGFSQAVGRIDVAINGRAAGSANVNGAQASVPTSIWESGPVEITAVWVFFRNGIEIAERTNLTVNVR
jgi:hypothetical protein